MAIQTSSPKNMTENYLRNFPKVDLHRHLEGTFNADTLFSIAKRNKIEIPSEFSKFKEQVQFPKDSEPDFLKFLSKFRNDWYRTYQDVEEITYNSVKGFKSDGLYYIELRFSPEHFAFFNNFDRREITQLIIDTANQAAKEDGVLIKYIITFNRSKQNQFEMLDLYNMLLDMDHEDIVGMDLAGDETNFPPEQFEQFFKKVHNDKRFKATIHAGEVTPSQQIWYAVKHLYASRIGHGTSTIKDPKLQTFLKDRGVALEQCITSNYQTGSWVDEHQHPFGELYRLGVPVTLNSDDPFIQDTDLSDDYVKAVQYFNLDRNDLVRINQNALEAAFVSDTEKKVLLADYQRSVDQFEI